MEQHGFGLGGPELWEGPGGQKGEGADGSPVPALWPCGVRGGASPQGQQELKQVALEGKVAVLWLPVGVIPFPPEWLIFHITSCPFPGAPEASAPSRRRNRPARSESPGRWGPRRASSVRYRSSCGSGR